jgi:hypothetical protein
MIDVVEINSDMRFYDTNVKRAENVLATQLGSLDYEPDFGIDLRYFLSEEFEFQNESFRAYLLQRLAESNIDVSSILEVVETLYTQYTFNLTGRENSTALVR